MTELTLKQIALQNLVLAHANAHNHDKDYWCSKRQHWVRKEEAKFRNDRPVCPLDGCRLSSRIRAAACKHEERVTRY